MRTEAEVYRFTWCSSFGATPRFAPRAAGRDAAERSVYRRSRVRANPAASLTMSGRARLQDILIAASFWALDPDRVNPPIPVSCGLDGSDWLIEGRRKEIFRAVSRWSPRGASAILGSCPSS
jgi:hypothetical protein